MYSACAAAARAALTGAASAQKRALIAIRLRCRVVGSLKIAGLDFAVWDSACRKRFRNIMAHHFATEGAIGDEPAELHGAQVMVCGARAGSVIVEYLVVPPLGVAVARVAAIADQAMADAQGLLHLGQARRREEHLRSPLGLLWGPSLPHCVCAPLPPPRPARPPPRAHPCSNGTTTI